MPSFNRVVHIIFYWVFIVYTILPSFTLPPTAPGYKKQKNKLFHVQIKKNPEAISRYYHRCIPLPDIYATGYKYGSTACIYRSSSSVSSSYSSPPWLGAVKSFRPPIFAFPVTYPSPLPLHSSGAWLWG
jgi:hypothetical protein